MFEKIWFQFSKTAMPLCISIGLLLANHTDARAATISVNQTSDVVNGDTSSVANLIASDGGDGISLREAIIASNNSPGADTINLGAGTHNLAISGSGEDNAATGDLDISDNLEITGAGTSTTIVDANLLDRVFDVTDFVTVEIANLTIRDGDINQPGGGIRNKGYLSLVDVDVVNNTGTDGGGLHSLKDSSLAVTRGQFSNNDADKGGGIWVKDTAVDTTLVDVSISGNTASDLGGGIFNEKSALSIIGSTLNGNSALEGGGLYNKGGSFTQTLTNITLSGNNASSLGGGIFAEAGNLDLTNVTVTNNSSPTGSGIHVKGGTTSLLNTIVAGNTGSADVDNTVNSLGTNLIGNSSGSSGWIGSDILDVSPTLGALANNGGSTQTHALLSGSRGINEGNNSGAPAIDQRGVLRDATVDIGAYEYSGSPSFTIAKVVDIANISALSTLTYTITVDNDGDFDLTTPTLTDDLTQDGVSLLLTTGPTLSGDTDSDGQIDTDEIWVYTATYDVTQANLDDGNDLVNSADFDTAETASASDSASTTINRNPLLEVTKTADDTTDLLLGQVITYTYDVENTGNQTITNVSLADAHNGSGPTPIPTNETLTTDNPPLGDSTDGGTNETWDTIAPGDIVTFTATYTVTQSDVDSLQ